MGSFLVISLQLNRRNVTTQDRGLFSGGLASLPDTEPWETLSCWALSSASPFIPTFFVLFSFFRLKIYLTVEHLSGTCIKHNNLGILDI